MDFKMLWTVTVLLNTATALLFEPDPCPTDSDCTCAAFTVTCKARGLSSVPVFTATGLSYNLLDLSNNNIDTIGAAAFINVSAATIDLSNNPLQTVDNDAFQGVESVVDNLQLDNCGLTEVPEAIGKLTRLRSLNLRHNPMVTTLPGSVLATVGLTLETLDFSNTGIRLWPQSLKASIRLKKLLVSGNHLTSIPDDAFLTFASTLDYLDISYNTFRLFPDAINSLRVLRHLDLSFNLFGTIPTGKFTYCRHTLQTLYLVHVMLREIPPGLKDLSALQNLYLSYNPISSAQDDVFNGRIASSLKVLHIDKTLLTAVPTALHYLTALKELNITWNRIQYLENYIIDLPAVEVLYLDKNPIVNVKFAAFSGLPALRQLYIRNTSLSFVPNAALARATGLTLVDLSFNKFEALYDFGFPGMSNLQELVLAGNPMANISDNAFVDLTGVTVLNLENCLLTGVPKAVQQMHALRTIKMAGNNIDCTCANLGWVETWRANSGLIAKVEGQCAGGNSSASIQFFIDNDGRSCS